MRRPIVERIILKEVEEKEHRLGCSIQRVSEERRTSLTIQLTKGESAALSEYAKLCGESVSDLGRKMLIREVTLADAHGSDDPLYDYAIKLPPNLSTTKQKKLLEEAYNKIRAFLGWRSIKL